MTLLAVERIKLFSTRAPVWCVATALALTIGATAGLVWLNARHSDGVSPESTQTLYILGLAVTMVMATLSVTTEYRFGTIKATFQAVPSRTRALLAKATVLALVAGFVGEISSFGSWGVARLITGSPHTDIATADEWREIAGMGLVYAVAAVLAVAVGALLRQSAAAVAILLLFPLLVEQLVEIVPGVGERLHDWMPFVAASQFAGTVDPTLPYGPWGGLAYFAAVAAVLLVAALVVVEKRDA
ncbi:ABC transporter permease [Kutzneria sp. 744]|uniref:ABC transporter permease n=1 Tax=Kutzneria sp. (strain 744) TaxID=345341 RepID=UPI0003EEC014|nr:ABC transporter permease [Kutzneria sp. 744]EWM14946.1 ABC transporter integral membrane subunit [Kutzneria sp. 744]